MSWCSVLSDMHPLIWSLAPWWDPARVAPHLRPHYPNEEQRGQKWGKGQSSGLLINVIWSMKMSLDKQIWIRNDELITRFMSVERLAPSRMFFSRMFNSFTSLSEGIWASKRKKKLYEKKTKEKKREASIDLDGWPLEFASNSVCPAIKQEPFIVGG